MDSNPTGILPPRITSQDVEISYKSTKRKEKKELVAKPKPLEEKVVKQTVPTKSGKGVLNRTKKTTTEKKSKSEPTKPTKKPV